MIKRGAYAWEPLINSMPTERTLITIDGMRIFGACTDKMDPITSYVEVSNLSEATISSGQEGACYGSTIGGSIDLKRTRTNFKTQKWNLTSLLVLKPITNKKSWAQRLIMPIVWCMLMSILCTAMPKITKQEITKKCCFLNSKKETSQLLQVLN
jgi:hypothetical protein